MKIYSLAIVHTPPGKDSTILSSASDLSSYSFFQKGSQQNTQAVKAKKALMEAPPPSLKASGQFSQREQLETEVVKLLIQSYFNVVKVETISMVPKCIMLNLVTQSKEQMQKELLQEIYRPDVLEELMKESDHVVARRKECVKMISALETASEIIATV